MSTTQTTGSLAEQIASDHLASNGLRQIERNFSCRYGEIDLIFRDREYLVFVEVRYRSSDSHGGAAGSIGPQKQQRLRRTAEFWLQQQRRSNSPCRFDVVTISGRLDNPVLDWIRNAF